MSLQKSAHFWEKKINVIKIIRIYVVLFISVIYEYELGSCPIGHSVPGMMRQAASAPLAGSGRAGVRIKAQAWGPGSASAHSSLIAVLASLSTPVWMARAVLRHRQADFEAHVIKNSSHLAFQMLSLYLFQAYATSPPHAQFRLVCFSVKPEKRK